MLQATVKTGGKWLIMETCSPLQSSSIEEALIEHIGCLARKNGIAVPIGLITKVLSAVVGTIHMDSDPQVCTKLRQNVLHSS